MRFVHQRELLANHLVEAPRLRSQAAEAVVSCRDLSYALHSCSVSHKQQMSSVTGVYTIRGNTVS